MTSEVDRPSLPGTQAIRVLLVDDQELILTGLRGILRERFGFQVVGERTSGAGIVEAVAKEFPRLTYDVTIKIEHILRHVDMLGLLRDTGCLMITSAVESIDDEVLVNLRKGHTRADFIDAVG